MALLDDLLSGVFLLPEAEWPAEVDRLCANHAEQAERLRRRFSILRQLGLDRAPRVTPPRDVPERLGRFRILARLGGGGMGVVYRALEEPLGREVALKLVRPEHLFFPDARERFEREVRAVARMNHPGIVNVHAVGEEAGIPYCAMEIVGGISLAQALLELTGRDPGRVAGEQLREIVARASGVDPAACDRDFYAGTWIQVACRIGRKVAEALAHAHARGIVHRDVKPSNVMLTPGGRVVLLDFGLAFAERVDRLTRTGTMLGSLAYMPPEQVRGDHAAVGPRSDIYSLGVTLYETLTLVAPYETGSAETTRARILAGDPEPIRARNRAVSADLETVVGKAFELDPRRRYANAADFANDLDNVLAGRDVLARPSSPLLRARRLARRHPAWTVALVAACLIVIGGPTAITFAIAGQRDRARTAEYVARIAAANAALAAHDAVTAAVSLEHCDPALRGWEWQHLTLALDGSLQTLHGHDGAVTAVALSRDAKHCASGGARGEVILWDVATGARLWDWSVGERDIAQLVFSADGRRLVASDTRSHLAVFDLELGTRSAERRPAGGYENVHVADGAAAIWVDRGGWRFEALDPVTLGVVRELRLDPVAAAPGSKFAADAEQLFTITALSSVHWDLATGNMRGSSLALDSLAGCVALDPCGRWFAWGQRNGQVCLRGVSHPEVLRGIDAGGVPADHLTFSRDGALLIVASRDRALRVIDVARGETTMVLQGHSDDVNAVACDGERCLIATASSDRSVKIWSALFAPHLVRLRGHSGEVLQLALLDGGRRVLSVSADGFGRIWEPETGLPMATLSGHWHWVYTGTAHPDGKRLATSYHNRLLLRDAQSGEVLKELLIGDYFLLACVFQDDGKRVIAGNSDGRVGVWDLESGACVASVQAHSQPVFAAVLAPGGKRLFTGGGDGAIHAWQLAPLQLEATLVPAAAPGQDRHVVRALLHTRGGDLVAGEGSRLRFRNPRTGALRLEVTFRSDVTALAELADGSRIVVGDEDGRLTFVDPRDGTTMLSLPASATPIRGIVCDPAGRWCISSGDHVNSVWRAAPFAPSGQQHDATAVAFVQAAVHHETQALRSGIVDEARTVIRGSKHLQEPLRAKVLELLAHHQISIGQTEGILIDMMKDPRPSAPDFERGESLARMSLKGWPGGSVGTGLLHLRAGRFEAALRDADGLMQAEPMPPLTACIVHTIRVVALARLGRRAEAVTVLATLRSVCTDPELAGDPDTLAFLREAEDAVGR